MYDLTFCRGFYGTRYYFSNQKYYWRTRNIKKQKEVDSIGGIFNLVRDKLRSMIYSNVCTAEETAKI